MKKTISLVIVMLLVVGMSTLVWAHGSYGPGANNQMGPGSQYNNNRNYQRGFGERDLDLSTDQEEQFAELEDKYEDKTEDIVDELRDKQEELYDLYYDKGASREEIVAVQKEINKLRTELINIRTEYRLDLREILSTGQLEQCAEYGGFGMMGFGGFGHHQGGFGPGMMKGGFRGHGPGMMGGHRW